MNKSAALIQCSIQSYQKEGTKLTVIVISFRFKGGFRPGDVVELLAARSRASLKLRKRRCRWESTFARHKLLPHSPWVRS